MTDPGANERLRLLGVSLAGAMAEARMLGAILPCQWNAEQRARVIALTGKPASEIDEIIAMSRMMNGTRP